MKRFLIAVLTVLMLCFVSCTQDSVGGGSSSPEESGVNENPSVVTVPVPVFGEKFDGGSSGSKGLVSMPLDYFNNDHYFACDVMTILPTMTNLMATKVYLGTDGSIKSGLSLYFKIYGFVLRLQEWNSRFNGDGIYLAYDIMYENSVVGFVNYYYNIKKQSFSYRQSVLCTFDLSVLREGMTNNLILNLEYSDIPIENPLSPEFKTL